MATPGVRGELTPSPPFDFRKSLQFLNDFTPMQGEQSLGQASFAKALRVRGQSVAFRVTSVGTVERPKLAYELFSRDPLDRATQTAVEDRLGFFLSIGDDLEGFYDIAARDAKFRPVVERFYGHKQVKFLTPFENAAWAVMGQRVPMSVARKIKERFVERLGSPAEVDGVTLRAFPEPGDVLAAGDADLREVVRNPRKAEYLAAVARAFSTADETWLRTGPYDEVFAWLRAVRGIGDWSAHFVILRGLGRMERLSGVGEKLAGAAGVVYSPGGTPMSESAVLAKAEKYGQWKGYWAYYLRINSEFEPGSGESSSRGKWM